VDAIAEWTAAQGRVCTLVEGIGPEQAERRVPACPEWTVRQLLAHMVGLGADVVRDDEPDDHNAVWTQRQVDQRADVQVQELVAEWRALTGPLQDWMGSHTTRPLGDVVIHEQDLRGALGVPGAQDTDGLHALRDRMVGGFGQQVAGLPPIALVGEDWVWCSAGEPEDAEVRVEASDFDLARAVMSRRSEAQLRSWTTKGDVEPYLAGFAGLGPLPDADLSE
jgi:uncharacterized protein (TIGR03083 family)